MTEKKKMKTAHKVLIGAGISIVVFSVIAVISIVALIYSAIHKTEDAIDNLVHGHQKQEKIYDTIVEELEKEKRIPADWKFVDETYGWGMESADFSDKYYVYIDNVKYDEYKNYWLEGLDSSKYRDGYNKDLWNYGDHVFHAININKMTSSLETDYENIHLSDDKDYYLVQIYNHALYYKYISRQAEDNYIIDDSCSTDYDSLSEEYVCYYDDDELKMEKLERK